MVVGGASHTRQKMIKNKNKKYKNINYGNKKYFLRVKKWYHFDIHQNDFI